MNSSRVEISPTKFLETNNKIRKTIKTMGNRTPSKLSNNSINSFFKLNSNKMNHFLNDKESVRPTSTKSCLSNNKELIQKKKTTNLYLNKKGSCIKTSTRGYFSDIDLSKGPNNHISKKIMFQLDKKIDIYSTKNVLSFTGKSTEILNGLNQNMSIPLLLKNINSPFPYYDHARFSSKPSHIVKAYGVNTYQGIMRNYNEDRVSIILNVSKPKHFHGKHFPKCSFFGIYDGHGGSLCADFLRDNLHHFIFEDPNFIQNPREAIFKGFERAENEFSLKYAIINGELKDKSGSCAIVAIIVDNTLFIANVGDSRAVMSSLSGKVVTQLSYDHKPNDKNEMLRIQSNGGDVYQNEAPSKSLISSSILKQTVSNLVGPYRVYPGRLSVSRTFGDVEAKFPQFGGLPNVVIATPEITSFKINEELDFIVLGCDGIFDRMSNEDCVRSLFLPTEKSNNVSNIHQRCGLGVDLIIKTSMIRKSFDNVTCLVAAFSNFEKSFNNIGLKQMEEGNINNTLSELPKNDFKEKIQNFYKIQTEKVKDDVSENVYKPDLNCSLINNNDINCQDKLESKTLEDEDDYKLYHRQNLVIFEDIWMEREKINVDLDVEKFNLTSKKFQEKNPSKLFSNVHGQKVI